MCTRLLKILGTVQILSLLTGFANGNILAYYEKSWTFVDVCEIPVHATLTSNSVYACGISCSRDPECRRFLFCSSTSSCKLFVDNGGCQIAEGILGCSCYLKKHGCINGSCKCQLGFYGDNCQHVIKDCTEAADHGIIYYRPVVLYVKPPGVTEPYNIMCYPFTGGGYAYILYRNSKCRFENFNRSLLEYETGFGTFGHNHWLGFDQIIPLLSFPNAEYAFNIILKKEDGSDCNIFHNGFKLNTTGSLYTLQLGTYLSMSTCGNSFTGSLSLNGKSFSTADRDLTGSNNCATTLGGGWWFQSDVNGPECSRSFLTGKMNGTTNDNFWKDDLGTTRFREITIRIYRRR